MLARPCIPFYQFSPKEPKQVVQGHVRRHFCVFTYLDCMCAGDGSYYSFLLARCIMEKRYKVHTGWKVKLEIVEVEKELPKSVQLPNGRVERKRSEFYSYYSDESEAFEFAKETLEKRIKAAQNQLENTERNLQEFMEKYNAQ